MLRDRERDDVTLVFIVLKRCLQDGGCPRLMTTAAWSLSFSLSSTGLWGLRPPCDGQGPRTMATAAWRWLLPLACFLYSLSLLMAYFTYVMMVSSVTTVSQRSHSRSRVSCELFILSTTLFPIPESLLDISQTINWQDIYISVHAIKTLMIFLISSYHSLYISFYCGNQTW